MERAVYRTEPARQRPARRRADRFRECRSALGRSVAAWLLAFAAAAAVAAVAAVPVRAQGNASGAGPIVDRFEHGGLERDYLLHLPADPAGAALVLVLHGRGGTPEGTARLTRLHEVAPDAAVAYPAGVGGEYNYPRGVPGYPEEPDDVAFLLVLADRLVARHDLDPARLYAVGFSNGGFMAQRLACDAPGRFAGIVSVAAAGFGGMELVCPARSPAAGDARPPVLLMHGTADDVVPWDGLTVQGAAGPVPVLWPVPETFAFWAARNGCRGGGARSDEARDPAEGTAATRLTVTTCVGAPVALTAVVGGGHTWPGAPGMLPASLGAVAPFSASDEIWSFLSGAVGGDERRP